MIKDDALRFVLHTFDNFLCHQRFTAEHVMKLNVLAHVATNTTVKLIQTAIDESNIKKFIKTT